MQKLQKGPKGNVGALRADAMQSAGALADQKASAHTQALAARRILSERWLCALLEPCTNKVGGERFSVLEMLRQKAEGATPEDATPTLGQAVSMLLSDMMVRISLHAYTRVKNGTRTSATDILEDYVLANPDYLDIGRGSAKPAEAAPSKPKREDACRSWELSVGHI